MKDYHSIVHYFRERRKLLLQTKKSAGKYSRELSDITYNIAQAQELLPKLEMQILKIKTNIPKMEKRQKQLKVTLIAQKKLQEKQELKFEIAKKRVHIAEQILKIEFEGKDL